MRGREKVKLSPIVQHILRFATGANRNGVVSLTRLLDSLYTSIGTGNPEQFILFAEKGLQTCRNLGYLYLEIVVNGTRQYTLAWGWERQPLSEVVDWDTDREEWQMRRGKLAVVAGRGCDREGGEMRCQQVVVEDILVQLSQGGVRALALYETQNRGRRQ